MKRLAIFWLAVLTGLVVTSGQEKFRRLPPYPEPFLEWRPPRLESVTLSNGLKVAVLPRKDSSLLSLQLLIKAGESSSPEDLPGVATTTARLINRGTILLSASDIEDKLEAIGGQLEIITTYDRTMFSLSFLEENVDEALSLLSQMIMQPSFPASELDTVRRLLSYDFLEKREDPDYLAQRQLHRLLFAGHPYERGLFTEDSLRRITRRDVQAFFDRYYRPENAVLVIGGNLGLSTASRKVSHYFNTWKKEAFSPAAVPGLIPNAEKILSFVDLPRAKEVTVALGNIISGQLTDEIFPFLVLNQVFGGSPHSRLFMNLRETRQLAYMAFSQVEIFQEGWVLIIQAKFPPAALASGLKEIEKELARLIAEKIPTAEIEQAKSYLIESFPLDLEPLDSMTRRATEILAFGLSENHWERWSENILTLEANKVMGVAQKLLTVPLSAVIVGDSRSLTNFFQESGEIRVYDRKGQFLYSLNKGKEK